MVKRNGVPRKNSITIRTILTIITPLKDDEVRIIHVVVVVVVVFF